VHRGESLYREIELTGQTVRIGRGSDNDLVLEDAGKSVSRNHAEIRYESGRYVLVDRESQNGVWVSGSRLPSVVLEPNVVASVGPYRLTLDSTASGDISEHIAAGRETIATPIKPPLPPPPKPSPRPRDNTRKTKPANWFGTQPAWLLTAVGGIVVGALALGVWLFVRDDQAPPPAAITTSPLDALATRVSNGDCAGVLPELDAFLVSHPTDQQALELKRRAESCVAPTPPPVDSPPPIDIAGNLQAAAKMLESGNCQVALSDYINPVLEKDPANLEATALKKKAESCGQPPLSGPIAANPVKTLPPEQGGLPRMAEENEKSYLSRVAAMKERYAEAQSVMSAADYQKAAMLFEGIVRDAGPNYMEASSQLADARTRLKEGAQKDLQAARAFESKKDWDRAIDAYRRARQADSSLNVEADIKRLTGIRISEGRKVCDEANAQYVYGRNIQALQLYQEAVKLLPADDPCVVTAKERFSILRR
jgi:tetratricopeptide (TPR) repeat protein